MYKELGAELKVDKELPEGPVESFDQLLEDQSVWISDLIDFVKFEPNQQKNNKTTATINDMLIAHNKEGYLIAVTDGSVKHMHQVNFVWVLSTTGGVHLVKTYGQCDGRGISNQEEAVGMLLLCYL